MKGSREGKGCGSRGKVVSESPETDTWVDSGLTCCSCLQQADTRLMDISRPTHSGFQPQRLVTGRG